MKKYSNVITTNANLSRREITQEAISTFRNIKKLLE